MSVKLGKEQIQQLLKDTVKKYKEDTGETIMPNQTPDNYIGLANELSGISNRLPEIYPEKFKPGNTGRYDIIKAQVRDAYCGKVDSLKLHFSIAIYEYLGMSAEERRDQMELEPEPFSEPAPQIEPAPGKVVFRKEYAALLAISAVLLITSLSFLFKWLSVNKKFDTARHEFIVAKHEFDSVKSLFDTIRRDLKILPYKPAMAEIEQVVGIYEVYTGSPQVRIHNSDRYHKVVKD